MKNKLGKETSKLLQDAKEKIPNLVEEEVFEISSAIALMEGKFEIELHHVSEAISYLRHTNIYIMTRIGNIMKHCSFPKYE